MSQTITYASNKAQDLGLMVRSLKSGEWHFNFQYRHQNKGFEPSVGSSEMTMKPLQLYISQSIIFPNTKLK